MRHEPFAMNMAVCEVRSAVDAFAAATIRVNAVCATVSLGGQQVHGRVARCPAPVAGVVRAVEGRQRRRRRRRARAVVHHANFLVRRLAVEARLDLADLLQVRGREDVGCRLVLDPRGQMLVRARLHRVVGRERVDGREGRAPHVVVPRAPLRVDDPLVLVVRAEVEAAEGDARAREHRVEPRDGAARDDAPRHRQIGGTRGRPDRAARALSASHQSAAGRAIVRVSRGAAARASRPRRRGARRACACARRR